MAAEREFDLASIDGTNGVVISGNDGLGLENRFTTNYSGYVVKGAGDVNGDGFSDVIVGISDRFAGAGGIDANESYVVFGSGSGFEDDVVLSELAATDGSRGFVIRSNEDFVRSGLSVDGAGDINGDGIDDFIVGDYGADPNGDDAGTSYVVFGQTSGFGSVVDLASIPGSDGSLGFAVDGVAAGDRAGGSVSGVGDVNSDGIDDFAVGAFRADTNGEDSGESYIVFGSTSGFDSAIELSALDASSGLRILGISADDQAGIAVSEAGDINNDGIADLVIGTGIEESYVVFGQAGGFGDTLDLSNLDGSNGFSVNSRGSFSGAAGDVNGDGIDDLVIDGVEENYVIFGQTAGFESFLDLQGLDGTNGFAIDNGNSISGAGDFNGDGLGDVVVGYSREGNGNSYIIFGATDGFDDTFELSSVDSLNGFVINGVSVGGEDADAGYVVSGVDDFNGDGFDDIAIGTTLPSYYGSATDPDEVYIVFGRATDEGAVARNDELTTDEDTPVSGNVLTNDTSVVAQRAADLAITAINGSTTDVGTSVTLPSGARLTLNANGTFDYDPSGQFERLNDNSSTVDSFSYTVTDGVAEDTATVEIAINGITDSPTGAQTETRLDLADLNGSNGFAVSLEDINLYNEAVSGIGDINGDGFDDVIIANYVVFGSQEGFDSPLAPESLDGSNGFAITGAESLIESGQTNANIGFDSVTGAGDVNGDGINDFVIAEQGSSGGIVENGRPGRSFVVYGTTDEFDSELDVSTLDGSNGFIIEDPDPSNQSGASVGDAGDVNGDGFDDLIVGAPFRDPFGGSTGRSFVIFGGADLGSTVRIPDLDGSNGFGLRGIDSTRYGGDRAGASVDGAGDINGDGLDDVVISAPGANESYVVFGSTQGFDELIELADLDGRNGFTIDATGTSLSGGPVSNAGDINNDGLDDIVISGRQGDTRESYVVFGRTEGFGASLNLDSLNGANGFAISDISGRDKLVTASGAGDVNGDGIDDIIVGSANSRFVEPEPGESYVIFGSSERFGSSISVEELGNGQGFRIEGGGLSVSGAGDFNGDGTDDLTILDRVSGNEDAGTGFVVFGGAETSGGGNPVSPTPPDSAPLNPASGGTAGNDGITGTDGDDTLSGLAGNDVLDGRAGADVLDGGEGTDTALYEFDSSGGVTVDLMSGLATDQQGVQDELISIENIIGSDFGDTISGDDGANSLTGRAGNDVIEGGLGDDTILGGDGIDSLVGGGGADNFLFMSVAEGGDRIDDFEVGIDKLLLIGSAFGGLASGEPSAELFFTGAEATSGSSRLGYDSASSSVLFDADGAGGADAQVIASLNGTPGFSSTDIVVL